MGATSLAEKGASRNSLAGALKSVFAIAEAYPDLKANQNFLSLQGELTDTEDKIQAARRFYNGNVRDLNTSIQVFPGSVIAGTSTSRHGILPARCERCGRKGAGGGEILEKRKNQKVKCKIGRNKNKWKK